MEEHLCYSTDVSETDDTASVGYITSTPEESVCCQKS